MPNQNDTRWTTRIIRRLDGWLYALMNIRVALVLLAVAGVEALLSSVTGWHWALASLATATVAGGLILAGASLWLSSIGQASQKILEAYQKEIRGAATPQGPAATLPRVN